MVMRGVNSKPILLFDGVCNLCAGSVQFIIKRDPGAQLKFASLQSDAGKKLLEAHDLPVGHLKSLVLIENGKAYTRSTGALRVSRYLNAAWPLLYGLIIVPAFVRNVVYDWVGKNRYKWFGEKTECWIPTPALKARFLD
jgi:predicted DCC family thiol-disulfide oxidoreductase YuxK